MKKYTLISLNKTGKWETIGNNVTRKQIKIIIGKAKQQGYYSFVKTTSLESLRGLYLKYPPF